MLEIKYVEIKSECLNEDEASYLSGGERGVYNVELVDRYYGIL